MKMTMTMNTTNTPLCDDDSPFECNSSFVLYLEPIYNSYLKIYQNVITLNCAPSGPLSKMVTQINFQKLSPFQQAGPLFDGQCVYVLLRYPVCKVGSGNSAFKYNRAFMGAQDIPSVFSYLQSNGYHIDTSMTSMLQDSAINVGGVSETRYSGNRKMIAMVNS